MIDPKDVSQGRYLARDFFGREIEVNVISENGVLYLIKDGSIGLDTLSAFCATNQFIRRIEPPEEG